MADSRTPRRMPAGTGRIEPRSCCVASRRVTVSARLRGSSPRRAAGSGQGDEPLATRVGQVLRTLRRRSSTPRPPLQRIQRLLIYSAKKPWRTSIDSRGSPNRQTPKPIGASNAHHRPTKKPTTRPKRGEDDPNHFSDHGSDLRCRQHADEKILLAECRIRRQPFV